MKKAKSTKLLKRSSSLNSHSGGNVYIDISEKVFTLNHVFKNKLLETLDENLKLKYLQLNTKKKYRSDEMKEYLAG